MTRLNLCECGRVPKRYTEYTPNNGAEYGYACPKCDLVVGLYPTEAEAIAVWNDRGAKP